MKIVSLLCLPTKFQAHRIIFGGVLCSHINYYHIAHVFEIFVSGYFYYLFVLHKFPVEAWLFSASLGMFRLARSKEKYELVSFYLDAQLNTKPVSCALIQNSQQIPPTKLASFFNNTRMFTYCHHEKGIPCEMVNLLLH